jgi:hypothetical protein
MLSLILVEKINDSFSKTSSRAAERYIMDPIKSLMHLKPIIPKFSKERCELFSELIKRLVNTFQKVQVK